MQQRFEQETTSKATHTSAFGSQSSAEKDASAEGDSARLEDYLDQVCTPFVGTLPYAARRELRLEIGQHLAALVEAFRELGEPHETAVTLAIEKFGPPETVAKQWLPAGALRRRKQGLKRWARQQWQGMAASLALCGTAALLCLTFRPAPLTSSQPAVTLPRTQLAQNDPTLKTAPLDFTHARLGISRANFSVALCASCHVSGSFEGPKVEQQITAQEKAQKVQKRMQAMESYYIAEEAAQRARSRIKSMGEKSHP